MNKGNGCEKCHVNEFDCDDKYRSYRCAALRAEHGYDHDPFTNADHLRSMTDEELAKFVENIAASVMNGNYCGSLGKSGNEKRGCWDSDAREDCVACAFDWLQQEYADGHDATYKARQEMATNIAKYVFNSHGANNGDDCKFEAGLEYLHRLTDSWFDDESEMIEVFSRFSVRSLIGIERNLQFLF